MFFAHWYSGTYFISQWQVQEFVLSFLEEPSQASLSQAFYQDFFFAKGSHVGVLADNVHFCDYVEPTVK